MDSDEDLWTSAERHYGLLRPDDVRLAGLSKGQRQTLERSGALERLSPRVLRRTGSPRSQFQAAMASVLDAGEGAVLAGDSAAWLWRLPGFPFVEPIELTRERGVTKLHRNPLGVIKERRSLLDAHVTEVAEIPVLTLPVLLFQLAGRCNPFRLARVADTVVARSPAVLQVLHEILPQLAAPGRNGITVMRRYLETRPVGSIPPTGLERRFETVVQGTEVGALRRQVDLGGHEWIGRVDYFDDVTSLIVEIQSRTFHDSETDRAADQRRVDRLLAAGFAAVLQIHEDVIWYRPNRVVTALLRARTAIRRADPTCFVMWNDDPGLSFHMTKREDAVGGGTTRHEGEGRMSA